MGYLLPALTEEKFENQRDVVLNERRQNYENRPYGLAGVALAAALFPPQHPYHWLTIGSADDLRAASLDEVARVLRAPTIIRPTPRWRWPATSTPTARFELAEQYFGDIPAGPRPRRSRPTPRSRQTAPRCSKIAWSCRGCTSRWHSPAMFAPGRCGARSCGRPARPRQDLAAVQAARLRTADRDRRVAYQHSREMSGVFQIATHRRARRGAAATRGGDRRDAAASSAPTGPTADGAGARARADRRAVHLSPADDRRLRRQVRSAERLQRVSRRPGLFRRGPRPLRATSRRESIAAAVGRWLRRPPSRRAQRRARAASASWRCRVASRSSVS